MSYTNSESSEKHNMMPVNLFRCQCSRRRVLRGNPVIRQDYTYFNWTDVNGAGRLKQVTSGIMSDTDSPHKTGAGRLQDLRYTYDENGNVLTIKDYKADNPQTQSFTYDELDRLSTGRADNAAGIEMERDGGSIASIDGTYAYETYTYNNSTGNLFTKAGVSYTYGDSNHKHAVTATGSDTYTYDANGNQITRNVGGSSYTLSYDAENRLVSVSGAVTAIPRASGQAFVYDGDGNRVKGTVAGSTITYLGNPSLPSGQGYFEWTGSTSTMNVRSRYYYAGSIKVAMRTGSSTLNYLLGDHLGSNAITTSSTGVKNSEIRYMPWGTTRYTSGSSPTTMQYTGQRVEVSLGLLFYNARYYDPAAGRFLQADSVVPGGVQGLDRYAYANNNPLKYTDPTGHQICDSDGYCGILYPINNRPSQAKPEPKLDLNDVNDPENRNNPDPVNGYPDGYIKAAWDNYQKIWHWLMENGYKWAIDANGKINDIVLMELIIYGEFGEYKNRYQNDDGLGNYADDIYNAALGALSNQYNRLSGGGNIQCGGGCTLAEQIGWLSDMASWYNGQIYNGLVEGNANWERYQEDANRAADGIISDMWMWGNVAEPRPGDLAFYDPNDIAILPWFVVHP